MADDVEVFFGAQIEGVVAGVEEVKAQIESLGEFTQGIMSTFSELGEAIMAAFAVEQIAHFAESISDLGGKIESASAQLGLSTEQIISLKYAAEIADVSLDQSTRTIDRFYMSAQQAGTATSRQAMAFHNLGINVEQYLASGHSLTDLLELTVQKLGELGDGAAKSQYIMDLFGNRSAQTARFINTLADGMQKLTEVSQALDPPTQKNIDELNEMHVRIVDLESVMTNWGMGLSQIGLLAVRCADGFVEFLKVVEYVFTAVGIILDTAAKELADFAAGAVSTLGSIVHFDWSETKDKAHAAFAGMKGDIAQAGEAFDALNKQTAAFIKELESPALKGIGTNKEGPQPPPIMTGGKNKGPSQTTEWQAELDQQLLDQQLFGEKAKAYELQFWQEKLGIAKQGTQEYDEILQKVYNLESETYSKDVQEYMASLNAKQEAAKQDWGKVQQIEQQKLAFLKQIYGEDSAQYQQELRKKEQMDLQHIQQEENRYKQMFQSIFNSFNSAIDGMIKGTQSFAQSMQDVFMGILNSVLSILEKMAAEWLAKQLVEQTSAKASAMVAVGASAAQAGAAAYASTAAIPVIGPELAPAAGAAAYAGAMAYEGLAGLAVGAWEIPHDMPAMIHAGESVVPKTFAQGLRDNGGFGGGGGDVHLHVSAVDGQSVARLFANNGAAIASALRTQVRNFNPALAGA